MRNLEGGKNICHENRARQTTFASLGNDDVFHSSEAGHFTTASVFKVAAVN